MVIKYTNRIKSWGTYLVERQKVQASYEKARQAWPGVHVSLDVFGQRVTAALVKLEEDAIAYESLYLVGGLCENLPTAWVAFEKTFGSFIENTALKYANRNSALAQDLAQEVREKVMTAARNYLGGSLHGWLSALVRYSAMDHFRRAARETSADELESTPCGAWDISDEGLSAAATKDRLDRSECEQLFGKILPPALQSLHPEMRIAVESKFLHGLTGREIAKSVLHMEEYTLSRRLKDGLALLRKRLVKLADELRPGARKDLMDCLGMFCSR